VPGVIAAEGVVGAKGFAAGVCGGGVAGLAVARGAGDGAVGVIAAEGVVVDGLAAGVCAGGVLRLARSPAAGVGVVGVTAAEGDVAGLALPAGAGDGVAGVIAADGVVGVAGLAAGPCNGAVAGLALPGAADGVPGVTAAEGVVGVTDVPVADGSGCPFIPGSGWPRCGGGCVAADAGAFGCAAPCGLCGCSVAAFRATEGGSDGASEAAGTGAAGADAAGAGAACCADAGCAAGAMATAGGTVWVWPLGFVIVTVFVTLLTTTVLWTLL
jgi:hypothetical protein